MYNADGVISGFCISCRCSVTLYGHKVKLDNGEVVSYWEGVCPVCGRIIEDDII